MSSFITADWFALGKDAQLRKFELYPLSLGDDLDVDNMFICAAMYGGPIAFVRDRKKLVKVQVMTKPVINIFSSSGEKLSSILWNSGQLLYLGWSSDEHLLCVKNDGHVLVYDIFGSFLYTFSMGDEASATKVVEAKIFPSSSGTGLAVLTSKHRVFLVNSVTNPKARQFPPLPRHLSDEVPREWEIVSDRETKVIINTGKELTLLQQGGKPMTLHPDFRDDCTGYIDMCVSLDSRHIAFLTDANVLWLGSSDIKRKYCEVNTKCTSRPKQIVWCGADAVIGNWPQELLIVSRHGGVASLPSLTSVWLVPEIDSVRVFGPLNHEIIQKVPSVTQKLFNINSTEPGSYLLEASKQFEKKSHNSYDYLHLVRGNMETAIKQCLEGARYEFNTDVQKSLLRAAKLGRSFAPDAEGNEFINTCRVLRVLNAVRNQRIGIPLTYDQTLLDRLVYRHHYKVAIEMAKYLKLGDADGASRILAHWACHKIKQTKVDEDQLAIEIANKLESASGVSFSTIANQAIDAGRNDLAIKLLDYEPEASLQVPLLLRLDQRKLALERAVKCGNTDLIYWVLLSLRRSLPLSEFLLYLRSYPLAQSLYKKYCRLHSPDTFRDISQQEANTKALVEGYVQDYFDPKNTTKAVSLNSAIECCSSGKQEFLAGILKDQQKLQNYQQTLEGDLKRDFVGKSVHDTIKLLLELKDLRRAEKFKAEFKVTDRHFWWLRLETMANNKEWMEIEKLAKTKKSPIGFEPFVDICLEHGEMTEAFKYLSRVQDDLKVNYYVKAGKYEEAAKIAFDQKDEDALIHVLNNGGAQIEGTVNQYLSQLKTK